MPRDISFQDGLSSQASGQLTKTGGFQQTGSLSWVELLKVTMSGSVETFSRYSACRVDPYTAVVAKAICMNFRLSSKGRKNMEEALSQLRSFGSLGDVLWFGFGVNHFVRMFATTEQGVICLAFCASMLECYDESIAAEIMTELALLRNAPGELTPSIFEWKALLRACAGVLASTSFPRQAEALMSFHPSMKRLAVHLYGLYHPSRTRGCSSSKAIAEALFGIGKITCGQIASMTIIGGSDGGWLAAVAEWLFGLTISIHGSQGDLLHTNCANEHDAPQVQIIYTTNSDGEFLEERSVRCVGKTYILPNASILIKEEKVKEGSYAAIVAGRVPWDQALIRTFGLDFERLLGMSQLCGSTLGYAARIFKAIELVEDGVPLSYRVQCTTYCDASHGKGFINNVIHWFPELASLRRSMEEAVRTSFTGAKNHFEANLSVIQHVCDCHRCRHDGDDEEERFCYVILIDTILSLARCLSAVSVTTVLDPTRIGLERFYARQCEARRHCDELTSQNALEEIGPIIFTLDIGGPYAWNLDDIYECRLLQALQLFGGRDSEEHKAPDISAISMNGICVYLDILQNLSDTNDHVGRVNVIPGRVEMNQKSYDSLQDIKVPNSTVIGEGSHPSTYNDLSIIVEEKSEALRIAFEIKGPSAPTRRIGPAELTNYLTTRRGLVHCRGTKCSVMVAGLDQSLTRDTGIQLHVNGHSVYVLQGNLLSRWAAIGKITTANPLCGIMIVGKECVQCCLREAIALERKDSIVLVNSGKGTRKRAMPCA